MIAPPGTPNMTETPSRRSASHMICAPVRTSDIAEHRAVAGIGDQCRVSRKPTLEASFFRLGATLAQVGFDVDRSGREVDHDHVAVPKKANRAALGRFR